MVKKGNSIILSTLICLLIAAAFISGIEAAYGAEKHHEPTRKSLKEHSIPKWLKDAKFGIYCHWKHVVPPNWPSHVSAVTKRIRDTL